MEQIGTAAEILADVRIKEDLLWNFLEGEGLDGLVIGRQDNFAWITAGGDSRVVTTSEMGFGYLLLTPRKKWLVSHWMDGRRLIEEQAPDQGYELVTLYWHEGDLYTSIRTLRHAQNDIRSTICPNTKRMLWKSQESNETCACSRSSQD